MEEEGATLEGSIDGETDRRKVYNFSRSFSSVDFLCQEEGLGLTSAAEKECCLETEQCSETLVGTGLTVVFCHPMKCLPGLMEG